MEAGGRKKAASVTCLRMPFRTLVEAARRWWKMNSREVSAVVTMSPRVYNSTKALLLTVMLAGKQRQESEMYPREGNQLTC